LQRSTLVTSILAQLTEWLVRHTYAVVFVATLVDATAIPFPGRIVLVGAGAIAAAGDASIVLVVAPATAAVLVTDHLWYFAGPLGSARLVRLYCRLTFSSPDCVQRTVDWVRRFGALIIVIGRFVAAARVLGWPLARAHGVGYLTFLALDVPAAVAWTTIWAGLGWLLGARWSSAPPEVRWIGIALAVAGVLALLATKLWRRRRSRGPGGVSPAPARPRGTAARASRGSPAAPRARPRP
jgi:undecaprenyl-diphosphatase